MPSSLFKIFQFLIRYQHRQRHETGIKTIVGGSLCTCFHKFADLCGYSCGHLNMNFSSIFVTIVVLLLDSDLIQYGLAGPISTPLYLAMAQTFNAVVCMFPFFGYLLVQLMMPFQLFILYVTFYFFI